VKRIPFVAFFLIWADRQRWEVPDPHIRICHWLEHREKLAVLRCHRGIGKSTILAVYNAWRYYCEPTLRILHQSESDDTASKTSRDTKHVLRNHPLTKGMISDGKLSTQSWWTPQAAANDPRNASMHARGIMTNVTSARADEVQNDDVEVPRNIQNPEARERLRYRLGEQVHISVPGAARLFVGTPHTHDSIYDDMERLGADCLTIRLFDLEHRIDSASELFYPVPFVPEYVFAGIGEPARLLRPGLDYQLVPGGVRFSAPPRALLDFYAGCAWPARFTRDDLTVRRKGTRTINEWDSQYQLHSKPVHETRLDPDRLIAYDSELEMHVANKMLRLMLGKVQVVSSRAYWDPSKGKAGNDASAFSLLLDDVAGNQYWHCAEALTGDLAEFANHTNTKIIGGQVMQIVELVRKYHIPSVYVETNGIGGFVGPILRRALRQEQLVCGVSEVHVTGDKNARILAAIEPPLTSSLLWAHVRVLDGPAEEQMRDFDPSKKNQADDYLDSVAGALLQAPVRIVRNHEISTNRPAQDWRPRTGTPEVAYQG
jgi:hypothetical protein